MDLSLFFVAGAGIALLLFLVIALRVPAFLALLVASLSVGLLSGLEPTQVIDSIKNGMGGTLGFVAIVVGLGAILGQILESSGGIERIADSLIRTFGPEKTQWSLGVTGLLSPSRYFLMWHLLFWRHCYMAWLIALVAHCCTTLFRF